MSESIHLRPTQHAWTLGLILASMIAAAASYQSNAAWFLALLLSGVILASILHMLRNIHMIRLRSAATPAFFVGDDAYLQVLMENTGNLNLWALNISVAGEASSVFLSNLPPRGNTIVDVPIGQRPRGRWHVKDVLVTSTWPLGIIAVWKRMRVDATGIVYPKPIGKDLIESIVAKGMGVGETPGRKGVSPTPITNNGLNSEAIGVAPGGGGTGKEGSDDFDGHRRYSSGDSPRHIDWKAVARGRPIMVKLYKGGSGGKGAHLFDFNKMAGLPVEARLSQLARWIIDAEQQNLPYALKLPMCEFSVRCGAIQREQCLEALALYSIPSNQETR